MNAIEIRNLSKNFGSKQAVCGLDMTVPMGAIGYDTAAGALAGIPSSVRGSRSPRAFLND